MTHAPSLVREQFGEISVMSYRSNLILAVLALSWPLAAHAELQVSSGAQSPPEVVPSAQATATAGASSLTCKLGNSYTTITNDGSATLPAGTKIRVRFYPAPSAMGGVKQRIVLLKSALAPGLDTSITAESPVFYQNCTARVEA
jgi:hypothetical protein